MSGNKEYRRKEWLAFRQEVLELDGNACQECGRCEPEVILQVHHTRYISGRKPWEYPYRDCVVLCKRCHAAEHGITPPRSGWQLMEEDDLGDLCGNCELCGTEIRYQFFVYHVHWGTMVVGSNCCDFITDTGIASNKVDSLRRYRSRLNRFVHSCRWSHHGECLAIKQKALWVFIHPEASCYRIFVNGIRGKKLWPSLDDAKARIFDVIEDGSAQRCVRKRTLS